MTKTLSFPISTGNPAKTGEELANALAPMLRQVTDAYTGQQQLTVFWACFTAGLAGMVCASVPHDRAIEVFERTLQAVRMIEASNSPVEGRAH